MNVKGIDTAAAISAHAAKRLKNEGYAFVGRYLVPETAALRWKALTAAEAKCIREAGLALLLVWETTADRASYGASAGAQDGAKAKARAQELGVPETAAIYFAVDYNAQEYDFRRIEAYLRAARAAAAPYETGVYGSRNVVEAMYEHAACRYFWQCCAWSKGVAEPADVYQSHWSGAAEAADLAARTGFAVDLDVCDDLAAAGMWLPPWYAGAMAWAEAAGLIRDGRPNDPVTRAELATVLQRALGQKEESA